MGEKTLLKNPVQKSQKKETVLKAQSQVLVSNITVGLKEIGMDKTYLYQDSPVMRKFLVP